MDAFETRMRKGGALALEHAERFFMGTDAVHASLRRLASRLEEEGVPYAVAGDMALVAHGYVRTTVDIDVLVTPAGLVAAHGALVGLGYRPVVPGGRALRDVEDGVLIEFLVTGQYPGDGKVKPVSFPDPSTSATTIDGVRYLDLRSLLELKLASGTSHPGRLKDLADVQELIRALGLPRTQARDLNASVRNKYVEIWDALQDT